MPRRPVLALGGALILLIGGVALFAGLQWAPGRFPAGHVGSYLWTRDEAAFGGLSGLDLTPDGLGFVAVSDRGVLYGGRLIRNPDGAVIGVDADGPHPIPGPDGRRRRSSETDAEGIALAPDGTIYLSFEGLDRVERLDGLDGPVRTLPRTEAFRRLPKNAGLEALAIDESGRLFTLPEQRDRRGRPFPVWRWTGAEWEQPFTLPRDGNFLPVGADFGPDGRLYLLERDFRWLLGFRSRVSRFEIGPDGPGPREVLLETTGPVHDNLEGLAVWADEGGAIRLTMISDDNFNPLQRTEIVDYRVPPS